MKNKEQNITENKINPTNTFVGVDALVGLPPLQLNEIYNDDSFKLIERVPAKTVDLILEDMPYNTTACEWDVKIDLQLYWETRLRILKPTGVVILTGSQPFTTDLINSNRKMFKYEWIWDKDQGSNIMNAKKQPLKVHENVLIFYNTFGTYNPQMRVANKFNIRPVTDGKSNIYGRETNHSDDYNNEARYPKSIYQYSCNLKEVNKVNREHPTQKPVGLFEYLIRTYTNEGDLVFDGFGGSGTTAIAAHKAKRNFIVIEKEKKYFDLAKRRLDNERAQLTML